MNKELMKIEIKPYPSKVKISNEIRAKYYIDKKSKVKGNTKIPLSFLNKEKYFFNEKGVLYNKSTNKPQLANPRTVGTPRYWVVNFQSIWNQSIVKQARALRIDKLKILLKPFIKDIPIIKEYPIEVCINIYDTEMPVDISNKGVIYIKVIEDLLVNCGKIVDDKVQYVNCSGRSKFIQIENEEDIRMEIKIYKSDNEPI